MHQMAAAMKQGTLAFAPKKAGTTVSIIGTAGRKEDGAKMNAALYTCMVKKACEIVEEWKLDTKSVRLVSGGAAWSDHIAVDLFLTGKFSGLDMHLPCVLDEKKGQAFDSGITDHWMKNPGYMMNRYHRTFAYKIGRNSLSELFLARKNGATVTVSNGFQTRNSKVASSDYLIAFTWGTDSPKDGGTLDTWSKAKTEHKRHVSLASLNTTQ